MLDYINIDNPTRRTITTKRKTKRLAPAIRVYGGHMNVFCMYNIVYVVLADRQTGRKCAKLTETNK